MSGVRKGQIWASTDRRDVQAGHNQQREVVAVISNWAWLTGAPGHNSRIRIVRGSLPRHRLVEDVPA